MEHLIKSLQGKEDTSSFDQVKQILQFAMKAQIFISETHVAEHIDYFKHLLNQLNIDLEGLIE